MVIFAIDHRLEALDRVFQLDELAGDAGEHFGHVEGLRQEALDLAGAADGELVLFGQLVHAEDRDDVLKRLVLLQDRLHRTSHLIMFRSEEHTSELQSLMRISYAVFCLNKKNKTNTQTTKLYESHKHAYYNQ